MENPEVIRTTLAQAIGTTQYWKAYPNLLLNDGVKLMAEMCGSYWLIDEVFFLLHDKKLKGKEFIVFQLVVKDHSATIRAEDGNKHLLAQQNILFTDFPLKEEFTMFLTDNVLMLPTEY